MFTDSGMNIENFMLVSCVTVTTGRDSLIGSAIKSFQNQTYPNREMIIVSQGNQDQNSSIRSKIAGQDNIHFVEAPSRLTLGQMRNLSVELAHGELICQWDDDDLYHPNRITTQVRAIRGGCVASLYTKYLKYFDNTKKLYMIDHLRGADGYIKLLESHPYKKFLCGSILFRKELFHKFKNLLYPEGGDQSNKEEDLNVLQRIMSVGPVAPIDHGYEYCYTYHGSNVYDLRHHKMLFHHKFTAGEQELLACRSEIEVTLGMGDFDGPIDVCTMSGMFDYNVCEDLEEILVFVSEL
jgi:glycosyltransferase involved in cell wall biosynthesis